jgi:hypothetical protein
MDTKRDSFGEILSHMLFDEPDTGEEWGFSGTLVDRLKKFFAKKTATGSAPPPETCILNICSSLDCTVFVGGVQRAEARAGETVRLSLHRGTFALAFVSTEDGRDRHECKYTLSAPEESFSVDLDGIRQKRLGAEWYREGEKCYSSQDYPGAIGWYRKAAGEGHAGAQFELGGMYRYGCGVQRDYFRAVEWYRRAAEQGHAGAQFDLGGMYEMGCGVPQNYSQAADWYRRAAARRHEGAEKNLARLRAKGYI